MIRDDIIKGLRFLELEGERLYNYDGNGFKDLVKQVICLFDNIASFIIREPTTLEKDYLTLSRSSIIDDQKAEDDFYNNYFYLKGLLNKSIKRLDKEKIVIKGRKRIEVMTNDEFNKILSRIKAVTERIIVV